jgi:hypothetical protein
VEIELADDPDGRIAHAASAAAAAVGLELSADRRPVVSAWWRAGLAEALERTPDGSDPARYDAARSPRSTRGATRA